jgi:hypothetical protein
MSLALSTLDVSAIAEGLAAGSVPWDLSVAESPTDRRYEQIVATDAYDAWLIYWPPGSSIEMHDHGDSIGALSVVAGVLEEDVRVGDRIVTTRLAAGDTLPLPERRVHGVTNRANLAATSVHVYAPPLRSMSFYRFDDDSLIVERVEEVTT